MFNNNLIIKAKEELIRSLTILKLKNRFDGITDINYKKELNELKCNIVYSDFIDELSEIGVATISELINITVYGKEGYSILIDELITIKTANGYENKKCDVLLLSRNDIRLIKLVSMELDFIEAENFEELFILGCGVLDKYLCKTNADMLGLAVVQPNLFYASLCRVEIKKLLNAYNENFLN